TVHIDLPYAWDDGAYHDFAATYENELFTAYQDGQAVDAVHVGSLSTVAEGFSFGSPAGGAGIQMDEVAVYSSALTPGRIDSHWKIGRASCRERVAVPAGADSASVRKDAPALYFRRNEGDRLAADYSC